MENPDDVKKEVRERIKKFREIIEELPKHQKVFSEITTFLLETSLPESVIEPKANLWKIFWCRKQSNKAAILKSKLENFEKTIHASYASVEKEETGKESVIFEMFLKKKHLYEEVYSAEGFLFFLKEETSEKFLSSLEEDTLKLKGVLKDKESTFEEKKRSRSDKRKEIAGSFSAIGFEESILEEELLNDEISIISDFIAKAKTKLLKNEKKTLISLGVMREVASDMIKKTYEDIENIRSRLIGKLYSEGVLGEDRVFGLYKDFVDRTFVKDVSLLQKWLATGKKAMIIHNMGEGDSMWKEWNNEKEEEMARWYCTKRRKAFGSCVHEEVVLKQNKN